MANQVKADAEALVPCFKLERVLNQGWSNCPSTTTADAVLPVLTLLFLLQTKLVAEQVSWAKLIKSQL
jgi:hypothetical protein